MGTSENIFLPRAAALNAERPAHSARSSPRSDRGRLQKTISSGIRRTNIGLKSLAPSAVGEHRIHREAAAEVATSEAGENLSDRVVISATMPSI
jgi:hypothetical protein